MVIDWNGADVFDGINEGQYLIRTSGQIMNQRGKGFARSLGYIKDGRGRKAKLVDDSFFLDWITIFIKYWIAIFISLIHQLGNLACYWCQDYQPSFTFIYMTIEVVLPCVVSSYQCCIRFLGQYQ